jgi:predicted phosphoribosyltransferase
MTRYADRHDAGVALAGALDVLAGRTDVVVLGVPRGGVIVAAPVAAALKAPLDVLVVRKLGLPGRPELAMGAITDVAGEVAVVRNEDVLRRWPVPEEAAQAVLRAELAELRRREEAYRGGRPPVPVAGRTAVVVDDGLATGASMRAAVAGVRGLGAATVVVAVPVGAAEPCQALHRWADEVVCLWMPRPFRAVAEAYRDFSPTSDEEVLGALRTE